MFYFFFRFLLREKPATSCLLDAAGLYFNITMVIPICGRAGSRTLIQMIAFIRLQDSHWLQAWLPTAASQSWYGKHSCGLAARATSGLMSQEPQSMVLQTLRVIKKF